MARILKTLIFALSQPGVHQGVGGRADHPPQGKVAEDDGDEGQEKTDEVGHGLGEGTYMTSTVAVGYSIP